MCELKIYSRDVSGNDKDKVYDTVLLDEYKLDDEIRKWEKKKDKTGEVLIGTSGYDYKEWKGLFYPETVKHADFLSYYATQFNSLEFRR
jgi:hypothetical protein